MDDTDQHKAANMGASKLRMPDHIKNVNGYNEILLFKCSHML